MAGRISTDAMRRDHESFLEAIGPLIDQEDDRTVMASSRPCSTNRAYFAEEPRSNFGPMSDSAWATLKQFLSGHMDNTAHELLDPNQSFSDLFARFKEEAGDPDMTDEEIYEEWDYNREVTKADPDNYWQFTLVAPEHIATDNVRWVLVMCILDRSLDRTRSIAERHVQAAIDNVEMSDEEITLQVGDERITTSARMQRDAAEWQEILRRHGQ